MLTRPLASLLGGTSSSSRLPLYPLRSQRVTSLSTIGVSLPPFPSRYIMKPPAETKVPRRCRSCRWHNSYRHRAIRVSQSPGNVPSLLHIPKLTHISRLINLLAVQWYGESEFWAALGKVLLIIALILFTFITMLGGNPLRERFGFKYWQEPGAFAELYHSGDLGRFLGFLQCLIQASFTIAG